jgi:NADH dehydrogenase
VRVTLVDRRNFHLFQPLLYQVATGALSPANIATPLREVLNRQKNTQVLLGEVTGFDIPSRRVLLTDGALDYDTLVVSTGSSHHYFGHPEWEALAPGLKTIEDATEIRRRVLSAFEAAERLADPAQVHEWLTFVVVGGGPTGVELAGQLAEIARDSLRHDFRAINPADSRILLLEGADRLLPPYPPKLSARAAADLTRMGVTVLTGCIVTDVQPDSVSYRHGDEMKRVATHTVLWGAGVHASPLGKALADATGTKLDKGGRVIVEPDLTVPGHPEIFVIGDLANFSHQGGKPLPGVAQTAIQEGRYVARLISARPKGQTLPPFHYRDLGTLATIGRASAVADLPWAKFGGVLAWFAWLFIHLVNIVQFQNRVLVLIQWAFSYLSRGRSARLITGPCPLPLLKSERRA